MAFKKQKRRGRDQREGGASRNGDNVGENAPSMETRRAAEGVRENVGTGRGGDRESRESKQKKVSRVLNCHVP